MSKYTREQYAKKVMENLIKMDTDKAKKLIDDFFIEIENKTNNLEKENQRLKEENKKLRREMINDRNERDIEPYDY